MKHSPDSAFADVPDGAGFSVSEHVHAFRVPKRRFRKGNTYALTRPEGVILVDAVHAVTAAAVNQHLAGRRVLALLITHSDLLEQAFGPAKLMSHCFNGAPVLAHDADARAGCTALSTAEDFLADLGVRAYHTPGHTPGSVLYHVLPERLLFAGDGVVGRPFGSDPGERAPTHPPIAQEHWPAFVAGWMAVPEPVEAVLPLHGEPLFGPESLARAREAATQADNVMRE